MKRQKTLAPERASTAEFVALFSEIRRSDPALAIRLLERLRRVVAKHKKTAGLHAGRVPVRK